MRATSSRRSPACCRGRCRSAATMAPSYITASTSRSRWRPSWRRKKRRCCERSAMTEFLTAALGFILVMLGLGLVPILRGPGDAERMMSAQLIGSAGIAALLLVGAVTKVPAAIDVALTLALLAAFAAIAFVKKGASRLDDPRPTEAE